MEARGFVHVLEEALDLFADARVPVLLERREDLHLRVDELGVLGVPLRQPAEQLLDVLGLVDDGS